MEARILYFTVHSASNLRDVRKIGEMKVYAKVTVAEKSEDTEVDRVNKTNPVWNKTFSFNVPELSIVQGQGKISIKIELFCKRSLKKDKYVGEVNLSLDSQCAKSCNITCVVDRKGTNYKNSDFGNLMYSSSDLTDKFINSNSSHKINAVEVGAALLSTVATVGAAALAI
ncbi:putative cytochrome 93A1-like [Capsicum annuum]|nr:putative cytochrome 93A1-like [Capsicum annuum]